MTWTSTIGSVAPGLKGEDVDGQVERRVVGQERP